MREAFGGLALHNCAWTVDPYLEAYQKIPRMGYLDMGITEDVPANRWPVTYRIILEELKAVSPV